MEDPKEYYARNARILEAFGSDGFTGPRRPSRTFPSSINKATRKARTKRRKLARKQRRHASKR